MNGLPNKKENDPSEGALPAGPGHRQERIPVKGQFTTGVGIPVNRKNHHFAEAG